MHSPKKSRPSKSPKKALSKSSARKPQPPAEPAPAPAKIHQDLNNIIEVTEEYETNRFHTQSVDEAVKLIEGTHRAWWQKAFGCFSSAEEFSIKVKEEELLKTIEKLRTSKISVKPALPQIAEGKKKTLVVDIDQTLVLSSQKELEHYDFTFMMPYKNSQIKVYTKNRFGLESFLFEMSKIYEIVVYTTNLREYAEAVIKNIDKKKRISHVLYKQKCLSVNKVHLLKSLKVLGRQPDNVVFLDHNLTSGVLQPRNFLQIRPFGGQKHDRQLVKLIPFLRELAQKDSVMPVNKNYDEYCNREIRLKFNSIDQQEGKENEVDNQEQHRRYLETVTCSKRKKYKHRKMNSEVKSLTQAQAEEDKVEEQSTQQSEMQLRVRKAGQIQQM